MSSLYKRVDKLINIVNSLNKKWEVHIINSIDEENSIDINDNKNLVLIRAYEFI